MIFLCMQLLQTNHLVEASSLYCTLNSNISQLKTNTVDDGNKINMRTRIYTPIFNSVIIYISSVIF